MESDLNKSQRNLKFFKVTTKQTKQSQYNLVKEKYNKHSHKSVRL